MTTFRLITILASMFGLGALSFLWFQSVHAPETASFVVIHGVRIPVEVRADTAGRQQGLSGRASLAEDTGMLFLFPKEDQYTFWMKDMQFPLDFVWIQKNTVVAIHEDVPSTPPLSTYTSPTPADTVLELNAGAVARVGIMVGDAVEVSLDGSIKIE